MWELKPTAVENLGRVVNGMTSDPFMREDLMQEALSHWWNMECERPGQTLSWYLQSCSFHLRHFLARGRSVDSSKRRSLQIELPEDEEVWDGLVCPPDEISVLAQVHAREIMDLLSRYLAPREQAVLQSLGQGLGLREIGRRLNLSHPTVAKCRRKMAALAIRLGLAPRSEGQAGPGPLPANGSARAKSTDWLAASNNGNSHHRHDDKESRSGPVALGHPFAKTAFP